MNQIIPGPIRKQLLGEHAIWLENPTTQSMLKLLKDRAEHYDKKLIEGVRLSSDKESEDKLRSAISTCKAITVMVSDSEKFVDFTTTKPN